jgi:hypothetical protein
MDVSKFLIISFGMCLSFSINHFGHEDIKRNLCRNNNLCASNFYFFWVSIAENKNIEVLPSDPLLYVMKILLWIKIVGKKCDIV